MDQVPVTEGFKLWLTAVIQLLEYDSIWWPLWPQTLQFS